MIVKYPNTILNQVCSSWSFENEAMTSELMGRLSQALEENNGFGVSAVQIGIPVQAFAMKAERVAFMFNPKIVEKSDELESGPEGCLSIPGVVANVKRPNKIRVRFQDETGEVYTTNMSGLTARIFQHEYDHCQGILFIDRLNKYHRDKALKGYFK